MTVKLRKKTHFNILTPNGMQQRTCEIVQAQSNVPGKGGGRQRKTHRKAWVMWNKEKWMNGKLNKQNRERQMVGAIFKKGEIWRYSKETVAISQGRGVGVEVEGGLVDVLLKCSDDLMIDKGLQI